jgi:hypothetical protein
MAREKEIKRAGAGIVNYKKRAVHTRVYDYILWESGGSLKASGLGDG